MAKLLKNATIEVDGKRYPIADAQNAIRFALAYSYTHPLDKVWQPTEVREGR